MKNTTLLGTLLLILIVVGGFIFLNKGNSTPSPNNWENSSVNSGEYQKVVLGFKNFNYYPNTVTVKAGIPVRISLDSSVSGCYRSFTIKEFGIARYLGTPEAYVEFTPTKPGTYTFSCSMGMGRGLLIVE